MFHTNWILWSSIHYIYSIYDNLYYNLRSLSMKRNTVFLWNALIICRIFSYCICVIDDVLCKSPNKDMFCSQCVIITFIVMHIKHMESLYWLSYHSKPLLQPFITLHNFHCGSTSSIASSRLLRLSSCSYQSISSDTWIMFTPPFPFIGIHAIDFKSKPAIFAFPVI
jgi:hypothetical protein